MHLLCYRHYGQIETDVRFWTPSKYSIIEDSTQIHQWTRYPMRMYRKGSRAIIVPPREKFKVRNLKYIGAAKANIANQRGKFLSSVYGSAKAF